MQVFTDRFSLEYSRGNIFSQKTWFPWSADSGDIVEEKRYFTAY